MKILEHLAVSGDPIAAQEAALALENVRQPSHIRQNRLPSFHGTTYRVPLGSSNKSAFTPLINGNFLAVPPEAHQSIPFGIPGFTPRAAAFSAEALLKPVERVQSQVQPEMISAAANSMLMNCPASLYSSAATGPIPAFPYSIGHNLLLANYGLHPFQTAYSQSGPTETQPDFRRISAKISEKVESSPTHNSKNISVSDDCEEDNDKVDSPLSVDVTDEQDELADN